MYIGIDVGGTYTDAVVLTKDGIISKAKVPTRHGEIAKSLIEALDNVCEGINKAAIERVVISTTLITNLIAEGKYEPVAMVLIPGPGLNPADYPFKDHVFIVGGGIDYRGREIAPLNEKDVNIAITKIKESGINKVAVTGKFSCRNRSHEKAVGSKMAKAGLSYETGHKVTGHLNFLRRAATTMMTVATREKHSDFVDYVKEAFAERNIKAPIYILKADGGTLPLEASKDTPVETIFSGPAASILGAMALTPEGSTSVVVDIGGTTTDLALVLNGEPLLASKGVTVRGYYTSIVSFAVRSVPIGGDSAVVVRNGKLELLPERRGPAYCLGGEVITPTDAMLVLGSTNHGNVQLARAGLQLLANELKMEVTTVAELIMDRVTEGIVKAINEMFLAWEQEPAYRVWELLQSTKIKPQNVVGVGGAASGVIPRVAQKLDCNPVIPEHSEVANAVGAAVAEPTIKVSVRIDTSEGNFTVAENGYQGKILPSPYFREQNAITLAKESLGKIANDMKISVDTIEVVHSEVFNVIRGYTTEGRIYDVTVQTPRRILAYFSGQGAGKLG